MAFEKWQDEARRASAAACSAMKLVAAAPVTVGRCRVWRCCCRAWDGSGRMSERTSSAGRVCAVVVAPGLGLGLGLAAGCGRGAPTGLGGCLAAVLGFCLAAGAGFAGAWALASAGGGVLDEDMVVVVDEVVVVVEVVVSGAEGRAVGDGGWPWATGPGVGCRVL